MRKEGGRGGRGGEREEEEERERVCVCEYGGGVSMEMGGGRKFYHTSARCTWTYLSYVIYSSPHTCTYCSR